MTTETDTLPTTGPTPPQRVERHGAWWHPTTPAAIVDTLWPYIGNRDVRLAIEYGDAETGQSWGDAETGYIGRSTGTQKIPLVVHNARSMGGGGLLDHCIVRISFANKANGGDLYRHPTYKAAEVAR